MCVPNALSVLFPNCSSAAFSWRICRALLSTSRCIFNAITPAMPMINPFLWSGGPSFLGISPKPQHRQLVSRWSMFVDILSSLLCLLAMHWCTSICWSPLLDKLQGFVNAWQATFTPLDHLSCLTGAQTPFDVAIPELFIRTRFYFY